MLASHLCRDVFGACVVTVLCALAPAFGQSSGTPDPTLLPIATTNQFPLTAAYNALNVPSLEPGGSYLDPTTGVKIYKLTSTSFPTSGFNWGHDYSEGGDEVSLPHTGNTRTIHLYTNNGSHWLIDFTPGVGVSNPRQLSGILAPWMDLAFAFSNNPATPYYAYVSNGSSILRMDIRTMTEVPGNGWPISDPNACWMHQSENDGFFVWMRGSTGSTIVGYDPATGTRKTYTNASMNEPRVDRAGRYVGITMNNGGAAIWDWETNTITWTLPGDPGIPFAHIASLRRRWMGVDWNLKFPGEFWKITSDVPNAAVLIGGPGPGSNIHGNGNWIQHPDNLDDQWALFVQYGGLYDNRSTWLAPGGMVLITPNGQRRLLGHPYNTTWIYTYYSFSKFSPDGMYVLFTSDMNGSGRSDVFLAEVPTSASTPDTTPPTVSISTPANGATVSGSAVTVSANASDNIGVVGVQFMLDGITLGAEVTAAPYAVSWNTTLVANVDYTLTAVARDAAGNTATAAAVSVTVANDTTPPVISSVSAFNISSAAATITWATNEASDSQVDYGPTTAYGNTTSLNVTLATAHAETLTGLLANTLYHYRVKSRDAAGNLATSADFTLTTPADITPPAVSITAPTSGSIVSGTIAISASASDNVGVVGVQFMLDGVTLGAQVTSTPYTLSWDTTTASNGVHTLTAVARDASGNTTTAGAVTVTLKNSTIE